MCVCVWLYKIVFVHACAMHVAKKTGGRKMKIKFKKKHACADVAKKKLGVRKNKNLN